MRSARFIAAVVALILWLGAGVAAAAQVTQSSGEGGPDADTGLLIVKTVVGLAVLVVLAFLAGHPKVRKLQRTLGISQVVTAGFPFVALGVIARHPSVGILTDDVLHHLTPLLQFGLGWIGFMIGFRFEFPMLDRVPPGTALLVAVESALPFAWITVACGALLLAFGQSLDEGEFLRDAIILGAAGAMTAPRFSLGIGDREVPWRGSVDNVIGQLDEIAGIMALLFLGAFFRPGAGAAAWNLPAVGWIFIQLGAGIALGLLMYAMIRRPQSRAEFLAVTLGFIAFASGMAGVLHLSPIVVCFLAGCLAANLPGEHREELWETFCALERPIHYIFLLTVGALWAVGDWRGWLLVPVFVAARIAGKSLGLFLGRRALSREDNVPEEQRVIFTPLSVLAVAIVVSYQGLYRGEAIPWIVTAVIGAAIVSEVLVQLISPRDLGSQP